MVTVYALRHEATGEAYVGCTAGKLGKRMREHRCLLNAGKHTAKRLQERWNESGPEGFRMVCLDTLPSDAGVIEKREHELYWMREYDDQGLLLNEHRVSYQPTPEAMERGQQAAKLHPGNRWSPEANLKRRLALLGRPHNHGAKISATKQAKKLAMR